MNRQPTRLLRRSQLLPGESLPSFLARLAKLNYYDPPSVLGGLCLSRWGSRDQASYPWNVETFERIAALTGTEPLVLYAATAHHFASILNPPARPLESLKLSTGQVVPCLMTRNLAQHLRPEAAAQFCPDCLRESPYHRLAWIPVAVSACLRHQRVLADQCPHCQTPIPIRAIVEMHCRTCEANLTPAPSIPIGQDALGLLSQKTIQAWLMGKSPPDYRATDSLPDQPPAVLYQVVDELRVNLKNVQPSWRYMHKACPEHSRRIVGGPSWLSFPGHEVRRIPTSDQSYRLFATAFKSLLDWPDGFYEFLRRFDRRGDVGVSREWHAKPDPIYLRWFEKKWRHPAFQFVREVFEEYLVDQYAGSERRELPRWYRGRPARAERFLYATIAEAAQMLKMSPEMVHRLAKLGYLGPLEPPSDFARERQLVQRTEVLALRRKWGEAISLNEAAWWLGLSVEITLDLAQVGVLVVEHRTGRDDGEGWMLSKQSIVDLWSNVATIPCVTTSTVQGLVDLSTAVQTLNAVGLNAADIIECAITGELRAYCSKPVSSLLDALMFSQQDIQFYVRERQRKNKRRRRTDELLNRSVTVSRSRLRESHCH